MTEPSVTMPVSNLMATPLAKKRILLIDTLTTKRDLRASVMRKLGMEVDCAADITEARSLWRADSYNLVLMHVGSELGNREEFCSEIQNATPPQRVAFLVGKPEYLAASPDTEEASAKMESVNHKLWGETVSKLFAGACEKLPQRWGIMEACWRISAVRSLKDPRSKTIRGETPPSSWAAAIERYSKPPVSASEVLPELVQKEIQ